MPQEFLIVRCYNCQMFQVDQVKKASKWVCKICHEKQSIKKIYGRGSGRDCRKLVQDLNLRQGTINDDETSPEHETIDATHLEEVPINEPKLFLQTKPAKITSNWLKYLEPNKPSQHFLEDMMDRADHNPICTDLENVSFGHQRKRMSNNNGKDVNKRHKLDNGNEPPAASGLKILSPGKTISSKVAVEISDSNNQVHPVVLPSSKWFKYI